MTATAQRALRTGALALALLGATDGCNSGAWQLERMLVQPRYEAYGDSSFFADGRTMRPPPAATVPFAPWSGDTLRRREVASRSDDALAASAPRLDLDLLERGRSLYDRSCAACHGIDGRADTPVARRMSLRPPPSLLDERIRAYSPVRVYRIVTEGYGLMPSYSWMLDERDAWAVTDYLRALQASRGVALERLPENARRRALAVLATPAGEEQR